MPLADLRQVQFLQAPGDHIIFLRNSVTTSRSIACNEYFLPSANEVWGKVISLHLSVILFTGGSASLHAGIHPPSWDQRQAPPRRVDTPQGQTTPPGPEAFSPPPRPSACWEIRATSRRYASYWNAILFINEIARGKWDLVHMDRVMAYFHQRRWKRRQIPTRIIVLSRFFHWYRDGFQSPY